MFGLGLLYTVDFYLFYEQMSKVLMFMMFTVPVYLENWIKNIKINV